jgi:hypothetical protein
VEVCSSKTFPSWSSPQFQCDQIGQNFDIKKHLSKIDLNKDRSLRLLSYVQYFLNALFLSKTQYWMIILKHFGRFPKHFRSHCSRGSKKDYLDNTSEGKFYKLSRASWELSLVRLGSSVTRLGDMSPFGRYFEALGAFCS